MGKMNGGGVESLVLSYYKYIDRSRIQFDYFVCSDSTQVPEELIYELGGRVFFVPPYKYVRRFMNSLRNLFAQNGYSVVHSHINTLSVIPLFVAKQARIPVRIAHAHSTAGEGEILKNAMKSALKCFSNMYPTDRLACSKHAGKWMYGNNDFMVLNNAIHLSDFAFDLQIRDSVRKELQISENEFVIGQVGRLCTQKNQRFSLDVFSQIRAELPNAVLVFVGDGEDERILKSIASRIGIKGAVRFLGYRDDVSRLYQAFDVFILPSVYEGFGTVAIEAQASGLPCVFSSAVPMETRIAEDVLFISTQGNKSKWVNSIVNIASKNNRNRVVDFSMFSDFDIEHKAIELQQLYERKIEAVAPERIDGSLNEN